MHEISHGGISTVKLLQISNSFIYDFILAI